MNATFAKAIRMLVSWLQKLAAAALIVFNDFILRPAAPSWWSGKLSDFGALVVWPLLFPDRHLPGSAAPLEPEAGCLHRGLGWHSP